MPSPGVDKCSSMRVLLMLAPIAKRINTTIVPIEYLRNRFPEAEAPYPIASGVNKTIEPVRMMFMLSLIARSPSVPCIGKYKSLISPAKA